MIETGEGDLNFWDGSFWNLWWQKNFRNFASAKYQWLFLLYLPTIYGMFNEGLTSGEPWISATLGLSFLGGGFITLALGRFMANTNLTVGKDGKDINIHKQSIQRGEAGNVVLGDNINVDPYNNSTVLDTDR